MLVPPFGEEMNKSRPMLADVGRALAARGFASVAPDYFGTGDSAGEFRETNVECWLDDLARAAAWSAEQGAPIAALLCVRLGCIIGARLARHALPGIERTVFWQPVVDGGRFLAQFLRLRVAASMMEDDGKESASELRAILRNGRSLEIAGYELSATLADQLETLKLLDVIGSHLGTLDWIEFTRDASASLTQPSEECIDRARATGMEVRITKVTGEPFWSSTEIVRLTELVGTTVDALARVDHRGAIANSVVRSGSRT
jgi:exosortase A-associated hydrolase 2